MPISLTDTEALLWTQRLIALALVQQSVEFLILRREVGPESAWSWDIVRSDFGLFPAVVRPFFDRTLSGLGWVALIWIQLIVAISCLFSPFSGAFLVLLLTHTLIGLRWRGTFNGGSDFMTLVVLVGLSLAEVFRSAPSASRLALFYIAAQSIASYFIAGYSKLIHPAWRTGQAIRVFLMGSNLNTIPRASIATLLSLAVIGFEISFPLAVLRPELCAVYILVAFIFHLTNGFVLGLNRFILPWAATYPALMILSQLKIAP